MPNIKLLSTILAKIPKYASRLSPSLYFPLKFKEHSLEYEIILK